MAAVLAWVLFLSPANHHFIVDEQAQIQYDKYDSKYDEIGANHITSGTAGLEAQ
jgi:hypothetical protein